jgi:hypothetical protein
MEGDGKINSIPLPNNSRISKINQQYMVGCQWSRFDMSRTMYPQVFLKSLPTEFFQISSPSLCIIWKSWKHQDFEYVEFKFPTCDSNYYIFPQGGHRNFHTCNSSPSTWRLKVAAIVENNAKVLISMSCIYSSHYLTKILFGSISLFWLKRSWFWSKINWHQ